VATCGLVGGGGKDRSTTVLRNADMRVSGAEQAGVEEDERGVYGRQRG
jgi:hypothetical protein